MGNGGNRANENKEKGSGIRHGDAAAARAEPQGQHSLWGGRRLRSTGSPVRERTVHGILLGKGQMPKVNKE